MTLGDNNNSKKKIALAGALVLAFAACGPVVGCSGDTTENNTGTGDGDTGTTDTGTPPADTTPVDTGTVDPDTGMPDTTPPITDPTATPTFTPPPGTFAAAQTVTIASTTAGAKIYYTIDGTNPNISSPEYTAPISITKTTTLKAIAKAPGFLNSEIQTGVYTIEVPAGTVNSVDFTPPTGTYDNDQTVGLSSTTAAATICYTLDGSSPTCTATATTATCTGSSATYSGSAPIAVTTTGRKITAIACKAGMTSSAVTSATYTLTAASAVFNPPQGTYDAGVSLTATLATAGGTVRYTTDGTDPNCTSIGAAFPFGGLSISTNTEFRAITCKTGYNPSPVQTLRYNFRSAQPVITPAAGEMNNETTVTMTAGTVPGTIICWTTDPTKTPGCTSGATPACTDSAQYSTPPKLDTAATVRAVSCSPTNTQSNTATSAYTFKVGAVTFNPITGTDYSPASNFPGGNVTISVATGNTAGDVAADNVKIHYTIDGSIPTCATASPAAVPAPTCTATSCTLAISRASFVAGTTINAIACKTGYTSTSNSANYPDPLGLGNVQIFNATPTPAVAAPTGTYNNDILLDLRPAAGDPPDVTICYTASTSLTAPVADCAPTGGTCTVGTTYNAAAKPTINQSGTRVTARACKAGTAKSGLETRDYDFAVAPITMTPNGGTYGFWVNVPYGTQVLFGSATTGVEFRYFASETPGTPTCSTGTVGTSYAVTSANVNWVNVIACKPGYTASPVRTTQNGYRGVTGDPIFSPAPTPTPSGSITNVPTVDISSLSSTAPGFKLCYTTDGTTPTCSATLICGCIGGGCVVNTAGNGVDVTLPTTGTSLSAIACATGLPNSNVVTRTYSFRGSQPVFSPASVAWAVGTNYAINAVVQHSGSTWRAVRANVGVTPSAAATADWALVISQNVTVDLDATDTAGGKTLNSSLCWRTDGSAPSFVRTTAANHCTPASAATQCTTGTATTAPAAATVSGITTTTTIIATTCRFGFADTTRSATYNFQPNLGTVNGANNSNDFNAAEEELSTTTASKAYVTWDNTYLYLGFQGSEAQNTTPSYFHAYLAGTDATVTASQESGFGTETIPFADADFHVRARVDGIDTGLKTWNGTGWATVAIGTCHLGGACAGGNLWLQTGGTGATSFVKLRIPRSSVGLSGAARSKLVGAIYNGTANVAGFPGGGAVFGRYLEINTASALPQNTAANIKP